jgi:hypothetical protein
MRGTELPVRTTLPIDAHVHFHPQHSLLAILESAVSHFRLASRQVCAESAEVGALLLAEIRGADVFGDLLHGRHAQKLNGDGWSLQATAEAISLNLVKTTGERVLLVRGRQIVTAENLEVLALFAPVTPPDGLPLQEVIELLWRAGALPVVPWGFGKWWLARGRIVDNLISETDPKKLFLGDTGCRAQMGPEPQLFATARRCGIRILQGSDPLPLPGHQRRAGSYGFLVDAALARSEPASALKQAINEPATDLRAYGRRRSLAGFLRDQVAMQRLKLGVGR